MREIKFRAWDQKHNYMGEPISLLDALKDAKNIVDFDNLIFMQYTGLKDKNGKEIYEGDIVRIEESVICNWSFKVNNPLIIEFRYYGWFPFTHGLPMPSDLEVIGNIYENPELMHS